MTAAFPGDFARKACREDNFLHEAGTARAYRPLPIHALAEASMRLLHLFRRHDEPRPRIGAHGIGTGRGTDGKTGDRARMATIEETGEIDACRHAVANL